MFLFCPAKCNRRTEDQTDPEQCQRAERTGFVPWSGESPVFVCVCVFFLWRCTSHNHYSPDVCRTCSSTCWRPFCLDGLASYLEYTSHNQCNTFLQVFLLLELQQIFSLLQLRQPGSSSSWTSVDRSKDLNNFGLTVLVLWKVIKKKIYVIKIMNHSTLYFPFLFSSLWYFKTHKVVFYVVLKPL